MSHRLSNELKEFYIKIHILEKNSDSLSFINIIIDPDNNDELIHNKIDVDNLIT